MDMSKFTKFPLLSLLLCTTSPYSISFVFKVKKLDKEDQPDPDKTEWIKLEFLMYPDTPESVYLQGWMPRGVYQVGDIIPCDLEPDALEGTC
jgi:hypothetical protein